MQAIVVNIRSGAKYDVYIGRQRRGSKDFDWGNPFKIGRDGNRQQVLAKYRTWLRNQVLTGKVTVEQLAGLYGKVLGCWCKPEPCHGDILAEAAQAAFNHRRQERAAAEAGLKGGQQWQGT